MSDPALAAIASLQTSVGSLQNQVHALHGQVSGDSAGMQALASRVTACEEVISAHGAPFTEQAAALTSLTSRVTGISNCIASGDSAKCATTASEALTTRVAESCNFANGRPGIRLDFKSGKIELNASGVVIGDLPSEPKMITVTAGEWAERDMPANAIERYRFIGDQVMAVPDQYRDSAEFSTEDYSFDRDGSDVRTTLTYLRLETAEEAAARVSRPASSVVFSENGYMTITSGGKVVARLCCRSEDDNSPELPFVVQGDQVFVNQTTVKTATLGNGLKAMAGLIGDPQLSGQLLTNAKRFSADDGLANAIRQVIRDELKPGGMLHRG